MENESSIYVFIYLYFVSVTVDKIKPHFNVTEIESKSASQIHVFDNNLGIQCLLAATSQNLINSKTASEYKLCYVFTYVAGKSGKTVCF